MLQDCGSTKCGTIRRYHKLIKKLNNKLKGVRLPGVALSYNNGDYSGPRPLLSQMMHTNFKTSNLAHTELAFSCKISIQTPLQVNTV